MGQSEPPSATDLPHRRPFGWPHTLYRTHWPWVAAVVGIDYLSSLAYQPSVAFSAAGLLAPIVTIGLVAVTLFGVLPLYWYLAERSPHGLGSTGLLERLIPGWRGKFLVLVVLSLVATDLIFTRTFSAAEAAEHLVHSQAPGWQSALQSTCDQAIELVHQFDTETKYPFLAKWDRRLVVTLILLIVGSIVAWWFRRGVTRGLVRMTALALAIYAILTAVIVGSGLLFLAQHPEWVERWWDGIQTGTWQFAQRSYPIEGWPTLLLISLVLFPQVALGLSGYELVLTTMPMIRLRTGDSHEHPRSRIWGTRYVLVTLALVMSIFLLGSTLVTTVLIPAEAFAIDGQAANRSLAYLASGNPLNRDLAPTEVCPWFGTTFGLIYDLSTVLVLTMSGITVMLGMRDLIPPYLYRLGMDWAWSRRFGVVMYLFVLLKLAVTYAYDANPDTQRGAYLTGVLGLFAVAAFTAGLDVWRRRMGSWYLFRISPLFLTLFVLFLGSVVVVARVQPAGAIMALWFVIATLLLSMMTRFFRTTELRYRAFEFTDEASRELWEGLIVNDIPVVVPMRPNGHTPAEKEREIRQLHRVPAEMAVVFLKAELADASDFYQLPLISVEREDGRVIVTMRRCASVPHAIAAAALEIAREGKVPEIHLGWSSEHPLTANLNFVLFGQGNVPWMVYELIQSADCPPERRPRVMVA